MGQRQRVQAIAIQNNGVLFGSGMIDEKQNTHFFIGGGIEEGETAEEAIIRELREEANVDATIIFKFEKEYKENHHTFLVKIGEQEVSLGYDPEEEEVEKPANLKALQKLEFIALNEGSRFSAIDLEYFKILLEECNARSYFPEWYGKMKRLVECC
ncbi:NUDIX domain-containing protein [Inconstantimicrobium mannanitabidum]|uniref:Uncharacterized protein n=1 Tax=Inconstantimicrobium mannanitabidum TaxID=1604901 RepID=A0ACB5RA18_9CLOT|nr:NUDIX hydrolase [Clostridium sp. TW13]GKX65869.1 hypothetical protein rsdtw13_11270 [Clostridium sp. TW13]